MDLILLTVLGLGGGIFLPFMVSMTINVFTKRSRSLFLASIGAILGGVVAVAVAMILPLQFLHLIPLHEQFIFYVFGFGLGVLCFRLIVRKHY